MKKFKKGLCYRCEHRARAMEGQPPAKKQCARDGSAVMECGRYMPVVPVATGRLVPPRKDPRPRFAGIMSCREQAVGLPAIRPAGDIRRMVGRYGDVEPAPGDTFHDFNGLCIGVRDGHLMIRDVDDDVFEVEVSQFTPTSEEPDSD